MIVPGFDPGLEGNSGDPGLTAGPAITFQQLWNGSLFAPGGIDIHGISFRVNGGGASFAEIYQGTEIFLSTSSRTSGTLSDFPVNNRGTDRLGVFSGDLELSGTGGAGPNPFDATIWFDTPFSYDPAAGALLFEAVVPAGSAGGSILFDAATGVAGVSLVRGNVQGTNGNREVGTGLVAQLELMPAEVPLPSALALLLAGIAGIGLVGRRRAA